MEKFYIYGLRRIGDNEYRYVGKTADPNKRMIRHRSLARTGKGFAVHDWMRKYGLNEIEMVILGEADTANINDLEVSLIQKYQSDGHRLLNLTPGGDGVVMTAEIRAKISAANKGRAISAEAKAKMSQAKLGQKHTPERRAASLANRVRGERHPNYGKHPSAWTNGRDAEHKPGTGNN